jgi:SsrA-binding protein
MQAKGYTLVPTKMYFRGSLVKVEIGVAKGKQLHDKRAAIKDRDRAREMDRDIRSFKRHE